jgi:hypothetical protein
MLISYVDIFLISFETLFVLEGWKPHLPHLPCYRIFLVFRDISQDLRKIFLERSS